MLNLPGSRGFDYQFGFLGGGENHMTQHPSEGPPYIGPDGVPFVDLWQTDGNTSGPAVGQNGTYSCELYGNKAVAHISAHDPSVPLFFYVAFHDVHTPLQCPQRYLPPGAAAARKPQGRMTKDGERETYEGMLTCVSIATGNITDALKAKGMFDNSLIIWAAGASLARDLARLARKYVNIRRNSFVFITKSCCTAVCGLMKSFSQLACQARTTCSPSDLTDLLLLASRVRRQRWAGIRCRQQLPSERWEND